MRGIIAVAGAVSIAGLGVLQPPQVNRTANVLTVTGFTAGGFLKWDVGDFLEGSFCSASSGNTCKTVPYMSGVGGIAEYDGLRALRTAIAQNPTPTTVLGYSLGAMVASYWLDENAGKTDAPPPEDLSFVLLGNALRKYGGSRTDLSPTPETEYKVLDIAIEYEGIADYPDNPFNLLALANAFAGFQYSHISGYYDVDLNDEKLVWVEGNTTYVLIRSENIPLLQPLRLLGLGALADSLNGPLKAIIDTAYNRNYPGLVDPSLQDAVLQPFSTQRDADTEPTEDRQRNALAIEPDTTGALSAEAADEDEGPAAALAEAAAGATPEITDAHDSDRRELQPAEPVEAEASDDAAEPRSEPAQSDTPDLPRHAAESEAQSESPRHDAESGSVRHAAADNGSPRHAAADNGSPRHAAADDE